MDDPILDIVNALTFLVTPSPAVPTTTAVDPGSWTAAPPPGTAYSDVKTLLNVIFTASPDLTTVSKTINGGIGDVVPILNKIASALYGLSATTTAASALSGVQQALSLASTLAPGAAAPAISSGSALFTQLSAMLQKVPNPQIAADEIAALAQQMTALAALFPTA